MTGHRIHAGRDSELRRPRWLSLGHKTVLCYICSCTALVERFLSLLAEGSSYAWLTLFVYATHIQMPESDEIIIIILTGNYC